MSYFEHIRQSRIAGQHQHPLVHGASAISFTSPRIPVSGLSNVLNYLIAAMYPNYIATVATPAALPVSATANDYYYVTNDGDGNGAGYIWSVIDGAGTWIKRYDPDWSSESILAEAVNRTQYMYVAKYGMRDRDGSGFLAGNSAGQHIYGSTAINEHLTLHANSGDTGGAHTGYIQLDDHSRPLANNSYDLGTAALQFRTIYAATSAIIGTLTVAPASITDTSGTISFDNEHLTTTGNITGTIGYYVTRVEVGALAGNALLLAAGSITDESGAISFDNENLTTTGSMTAATLNGGNLRLTVNTLSSTNAGGNILVVPSTTGQIILDSIVTVTNEGSSLANYLAPVASTVAWGDVAATDRAGAIVKATVGPIAAPFAANLAGIVANAQNVGTNTHSGVLYGLYGLASHNGVGNAATIYGGYFRAENLTAATVTTLASLYIAAPVNSGGGTITNSYSLYVDGNSTQVGTGTVTGQFNTDNLRLDGNTLSSTNTDGNVALSPNGTGIVTTSASFNPTTDNGKDLGDSTHRYRTAYIGTSLHDGTNIIAMTALAGLKSVMWRDSGQTLAAQSGDALFFNGTVWLASVPDTEIDHGTVTGLADDDHTQYALLLGRSGGQTLIGGTAASNSLILESTSNVTKGTIQVKSDVIPFTTAAYSAGWSGTNLGGASNYYNNLYTRGQLIGARLENYAFASLPSASAQNPGRMAYVTDRNKLYADNGGAWIDVGARRYIEDTSWNGTDITKTTTVSSTITDARNAIWQFCDNANSFERIYCTIQAISATQVTIAMASPVPSGTYRLVGIE